MATVTVHGAVNTQTVGLPAHEVVTSQPVHRWQGWYCGQEGFAFGHTVILLVGAKAVGLLNSTQQVLQLGHTVWCDCCSVVQLAKRIMPPAKSAG